MRSFIFMNARIDGNFILHARRVQKNYLQAPHKANAKCQIIVTCDCMKYHFSHYCATKCAIMIPAKPSLPILYWINVGINAERHFIFPYIGSYIILYNEEKDEE